LSERIAIETLKRSVSVKKVRIIEVECVVPDDTTDLKARARVVEVKDDAHYDDMFAEAGLLFDPQTTIISYAAPGSNDLYGTVNLHLDSPDDGEIVMTLSRALLGQVVSEKEPAENDDDTDTEEKAEDTEEPAADAAEGAEKGQPTVETPEETAPEETPESH
jgi:hypothetical protein